MVLKQVQKIHTENSKTPLRQVLIRISSDLPDFFYLGIICCWLLGILWRNGDG